jgi:adenylosuccinate synthase
MFEGAQGTMLDIDHGTYPFVTSSSATAGGASHRHRSRPDRHPDRDRRDQGLCHARGRRAVPDGNFRRRGADELRARGKEYGAVTGRPRRCGWLDMPLLRYSNRINGTEWLVVTKLDVLDTFAEIPVCTGYKIDGKLPTVPADVRGLESIEPVYTTLPGWQSSTEGITQWDKLPAAPRDYLNFVEERSEAKIGMVSTGPDRDQTMMLPEFAATLDDP